MVKMSPVRVVLDSGLRLPLGSRLVHTARETPLWVIAGEQASAQSETALRAQGVEVIRIAERDSLAVILSVLGSRGITRLMVEGGPTLAASLIARNFVDEAILFHSPVVIGDGLAALDPQAQTMLEQHLERVFNESLGPDREERYERKALDERSLDKKSLHNV
jgi:diaminohydroxyphosphoribosylaminopyrimidine deaminase / 5-amino-6-(5-phosphoribosylamino)uracil reductase